MLQIVGASRWPVGSTQDPAHGARCRATTTSRAGSIQLNADQNGDGRIDQWTYLDGNRPMRGEADTDGDGRIDRWEYFDAASALSASARRAAATGWKTRGRIRRRPGRAKRTSSTSRDSRSACSDHREYFRGETLLRTEDDTNGDGRIDKWERYEASVLREAAFDTSFVHGRADRRVLYDEKGRFVTLKRIRMVTARSCVGAGEASRRLSPGASK